MDFFSSYIFPSLILIGSFLIYGCAKWLIQKAQSKIDSSKPVATPPKHDPIETSLKWAIEE